MRDAMSLALTISSALRASVAALISCAALWATATAFFIFSTYIALCFSNFSCNQDSIQNPLRHVKLKLLRVIIELTSLWTLERRLRAPQLRTVHFNAERRKRRNDGFKSLSLPPVCASELQLWPSWSFPRLLFSSHPVYICSSDNPSDAHVIHGHIGFAQLCKSRKIVFGVL